jgi:GDP-L-fucose synthase
MSVTQETLSLLGKRVWVAGHNGMVGAALVKRLESEKPAETLTVARKDLDLTDSAATKSWMVENKPDVIIIAAAKVGGIYANKTYPAQFIYQNLMIACNIIHAAYELGVEKLLYLGSSCIYPRQAHQPITEGALLTGTLEPTNEAYAIAKIAGVKLCEFYRQEYGSNFIAAMPTNLFGPGDNYHPQNSHVIPALIQKAHNAKVAEADFMEVWGTGQVRREFMHVNDCADGLVHVLKHYSGPSHINIGTGSDVSIAEVAQTVAQTVGFQGDMKFDTSMPDGTPRKLMSSDKLLALGWSPKISLEAGLKDAYDWYLENIVAAA